MKITNKRNRSRVIYATIILGGITAIYYRYIDLNRPHDFIQFLILIPAVMFFMLIFMVACGIASGMKKEKEKMILDIKNDRIIYLNEEENRYKSIKWINVYGVNYDAGRLLEDGVIELFFNISYSNKDFDTAYFDFDTKEVDYNSENDNCGYYRVFFDKHQFDGEEIEEIISEHIEKSRSGFAK